MKVSGTMCITRVASCSKDLGRFDLWSTAGLFRAVDVTMEVADLYEVMPAPADRNVARIAHTTRNYISNMTGAQLYDEKDMSIAEKESYNSYYVKKPLIIPALQPAGIFSSIPIIGSMLDEYIKPVTSAIEGATSKVSGVINDGIGSISSGVSSGFSSVTSSISNVTSDSSNTGTTTNQSVFEVNAEVRKQAISEEKSFNDTYNVSDDGELTMKD